MCRAFVAGPLGEEAGRQLQPLGAQLTRLSLQGAEASSATVGAAKVTCACRGACGHLTASSATEHSWNTATSASAGHHLCSEPSNTAQ
jgi:hypothetical protein